MHERPDAAASLLPQIKWVEVNEEPNHVELFRNHAVRVYEATIAPGTATQYHHHGVDTIYIVITGGTLRSEEPVQQTSSTQFGRSVSLPTKVGWLASRTLARGWLQMTEGTLLMQLHHAHPLVHRVVASTGNATPIRMLGIELHRTPSPGRLPEGRGVRLEYADQRARTYRVRLGPGEATAALRVPHGAVLAVITGIVTLDPGTDERRGATWVAPQIDAVLSNDGSVLLDCLLTVV